MKLRHVGMFVIYVVCGVGCTKYYFNLNYNDNEQQKHYVIDHGYCTQVSYGSVEVPQVQLNNNGGSARTSGNIYMSGRNGTSIGRYNSTTTYNGGIISGFANGLNISSVASANQARADIYESCLARLGWFRIEGPSYIRPGLDFGADLDANTKLTQQSLDALTSKGFVAPLYSSTENSYFLIKTGSMTNDNAIYYLTIVQIFPTDRNQTFPGSSKTGDPVAYKISDFKIDTTTARTKILNMNIYNRDNEILHTHVDSNMNSITSEFKKGSIVDAYLGFYNVNYNPYAITLPIPSKYSIKESYENIINAVSRQGYSDALFNKTGWAQSLINPDSITVEGDKLKFLHMQVYDVDRLVISPDSNKQIKAMAYYVFESAVDVKSKKMTVIGYKAYDRNNKELFSHINSEMELATTDIGNNSVVDRHLKKYSPKYAAN